MLSPEASNGCATMDTTLKPSDLREAIRREALRLGFEACGFATVNEVDVATQTDYRQWLEAGNHAQMEYLSNHLDLRDNPALLHPGARTIICVALNYYPAQHPAPGNPRFAYYAYGKDYHEVMREKLKQLAQFIQPYSHDEGRICCDTAPLRERYWAMRAGIGFIGKNAQLILPGKGSYFFLGELLTTLELPPDNPLDIACSECNRCLDACPTHALFTPGKLDARRCISCQTIENRGEIAPEVANRMGNRIYGCDTCQLCCPHNQTAQSTTCTDFTPDEEFLSLDESQLEQMTPDDFSRIFRRSAVKRAKYSGLKRNFEIWKKNNR